VAISNNERLYIQPFETQIFPWTFNLPDKEANTTQTAAEYIKITTSFIGNFTAFQAYMDGFRAEGLHNAAHLVRYFRRKTIRIIVQFWMCASTELGRWYGKYFTLAQWYNILVLQIFSPWLYHLNTSDPLFFLLHSQLDRVWAAWQAHNRRNRNAIAGGVDQDLNDFDAHPLGTGTPVTGDTVLYMAGIGPDATVNDVFSTTGGYLCYEYAT
jgi:tyrosinase